MLLDWMPDACHPLIVAKNETFSPRALLAQPEPLSVIQQYLDSIRTSVSKDEYRPSKRVLLEFAFTQSN